MMTKACELKKKKKSSTNIIYKVKMKESISLFIRQMSCEKKVVFITTDLTGGYQSWSGCWSIKKKKKIKQLIFASSQPVSNQTWRFTVAPIGLLVNCHLPTVFDPFCEHRLKCNTGITNTHNNIIHWDFSCHSEVVIQTKKKKWEKRAIHGMQDHFDIFSVPRWSHQLADALFLLTQH